MQAHGPAHDHRLQHVALQLLHHKDDDQHDHRVADVLGDQRDQHGDHPGEGGAPEVEIAADLPGPGRDGQPGGGLMMYSAQDLPLRRRLLEYETDGRAPDPWPDLVEPYRWLLQRIGDGVTLTGAGYLPPAVVSETMQRLGWDAHWIGKGSREDMTRPVAAA